MGIMIFALCLIGFINFVLWATKDRIERPILCQECDKPLTYAFGLEDYNNKIRQLPNHQGKVCCRGCHEKLDPYHYYLGAKRVKNRTEMDRLEPLIKEYKKREHPEEYARQQREYKEHMDKIRGFGDEYLRLIGIDKEAVEREDQNKEW